MLNNLEQIHLYVSCLKVIKLLSTIYITCCSIPSSSSAGTLNCVVGSSLIFPFTQRIGYRFQETCVYELITTCSTAGSLQSPILVHADFKNERLEVSQITIQWMNGFAIINENNFVSTIRNGQSRLSRNVTNGIGSSVTITPNNGIGTIILERAIGTEPFFRITISSTSSILSQLCGLCGDRQGNLRLRNGQTANPTNQQEVEMLAADFRVQSTNQLIQSTRQECGE